MIVLVIPVAALLLALVWVRWLRQPDKPLATAEQIEAHQRTLHALAPDEAAARQAQLAQRPRSRTSSLR